MDSLISKVKKGWNIFLEQENNKKVYRYPYIGASSSFNDFHIRSRNIYLEHSWVRMISNRIAMDCAAVDIEHVRVDEDNKFKEVLKDGLNSCLTLEANIDQTSNMFIQDLVLSMFDEGYVAAVPIDTTDNPDESTFDINTIRVAKIVEWFPRHVKIDVYNDITGKHETKIVSKSWVAIIENPLYSIMNEPNSTLQRLYSTLRMLDQSNNKIGSDKLDLIVQLPYPVKSTTRENHAEKRKNAIESQLVNSPHGIAYIDGSEKIIQLNRSLENNLWEQVKDLKTEYLNQLGLPMSIFDGTADESILLNYYDRTVDPILRNISLEFKRKFLSKTARTQGQSIMYFRDPFRIVTAEKMAEIADSFTRNEVLSTNEVRCEIGYKPTNNPKDDELRNKNQNPANNSFISNSNNVNQDLKENVSEVE